jgi:hypothetical protein
MIQNATAASYYSRTPGEVIAKLNEGGFEVYCAVLKEFSGFFIKFDETSLTLSPTQASQEYTMPADFTQMVHLAERQSGTENWHEIDSADDLGNVLQNQLSDAGIWTPNFGQKSAFEYYGPYLDSDNAIKPGAPAQLQKIRVAPITDVARFVQLAYTAKWVQIVNDQSHLVLPDEGTYAMEAYAVAKLLKLNSDTAAADFLAEGQRLEARFLSWVRQRQIQQLPQAEMYLEGSADFY